MRGKHGWVQRYRWGFAVQVPDWLSEYSAVAVSAFFGGVANGSRWKDDQGKWSWSRVGIEAMTALALSVAIIALAERFDLDLRILCGLGVLSGWLGPKPVADFALKRLGIMK